MASEDIFDLIESLEETYHKFLKTEGFKDVPLVRLGYYMAAINIVKEDPLEDPVAQNRVMIHLLEKRGQAEFAIMKMIRK